MRDWRNRQTRTFKGRVRDRVSSSLTSRTKGTHNSVSFFIWGEATQLLLRSNHVRQVSSAERSERHEPWASTSRTKGTHNSVSFFIWGEATQLLLRSNHVRQECCFQKFVARLAKYSLCSWRSQKPTKLAKCFFALKKSSAECRTLLLDHGFHF